MQIDRSALEKLLSLNDRQLQFFITKLATESGIDPATFNIDLRDVQSIRRALSGATEQDLELVTQLYEQNKNKKNQ